ncbi:MAG: prepilin-type N-terminal cleavage/methylation domain-containing protein [Fretibacterium sp.]|nr:prepilin-type N-terminal cleavage/methylation domain-containing protein [Fretibacterium sp.]
MTAQQGASSLSRPANRVGIGRGAKPLSRRGAKPLSRRGFTLIEIMLVLAIVGVMAVVLLPRIGFYFEPPLVLLQRSVEEAQELALSGVSVRFVLKPVHGKRGTVEAEVLLKEEPEKGSLSEFLGTAAPKEDKLVWKPAKFSHPLDGEGWRMDPETVNFFTDGSCTPARISWADPGYSSRGSVSFLLTVTGYCIEDGEKRY